MKQYEIIITPAAENDLQEILQQSHNSIIQNCMSNLDMLPISVTQFNL